MNFGIAVKKAMDAKGIKVADVARKTGHSYQHISDLLKGNRRWNEDTLAAVCEALDVKVEIKEKEGD